LTPNNTDIFFTTTNYTEITNGTINVDEDGSRIIIMNPNEIESQLNFTNRHDTWQLYNLKGMQWKVPSEHTVDNKQYAAELQIYHGQPSNNKMVVLSYLFDTDMNAVKH